MAEQFNPYNERNRVATETRAMHRIGGIMTGLSGPARERVLRWAIERFGGMGVQVVSTVVSTEPAAARKHLNDGENSAP